MHARNRSIQGAAILVFSLGLAALFAVPGTLSAVSYAAVATVLLLLTAIVKLAYANAHDTRTVAQLVAQSDAGIIEGHAFERRM
jgi:hypothetical protein